ncbi:MAG: methionyl-tRNA synthetase [Pseudohongiellaceae bacterium]|jgi:methionyl-tRNA synthetase
MTPSPDSRPLLVTSALPYANGPIHFGHVAGAYLPADIHVRYQRLLGSDVLYMCGTDEHGVSITVKAEAEGTPYREYVGRWHDEIRELFNLFHISFDHFSRTSNEEPHYALSQEFFLRLLREGNVAPRSLQQHFCLSCDRFLPDRYVEGTCYLCGAAAARGDECKKCGAWLEAIRIIEPHCVTCNAPPELRDTMQFEIDLSPVSAKEPGVLAKAYGDDFAAWLPWFRGQLKSNVRSTVFDKLIEGEGMEARPITRDLRWGVPVPSTDLEGHSVESEGKVLYVWFDAPIGYISATIEWARDIAGDADAWRRYWIAPRGQPSDEQPRLVHFLGKDNIPFHCIVFPAMLGAQGEARDGDDFMGPGVGERWVLPDNVPANEFYNLEGKKFSTSDNWMLDSARLFDVFGLDALRWYLTASMPETSDSNFLFSDLQARVNSELADTIGNYASRVLKFTASKLGGKVPEFDATHEHGRDLAVTQAACAQAIEEVGSLLQACSFRKAATTLIELARFGNKQFDERAPWKSRKTDMTACEMALHCNIQVLATLSVLLTPFVPDGAARLREMLALPPLDSSPCPEHRGGANRWVVETLPAGHTLGEPGILFAKIPDEVIEAERERLGSQSES